MAFEGLELPEIFDLDSLVDDSLINTCTLFDEVNNSSDVQMQNTEEKSPFHESDSGVSDIGGNESPLSLWENDIPLLKMLDNPIDLFLLGNEDYVSEEKEVVNNLQSRVGSSEKTDSVPEHVIDSQTNSNNRKTRSQSAVASRKQGTQSSSLQAMGSKSVNASSSSRTSVAKKRHNDSQSEDEIDIEDENPSRRKPKGSVRVKRAGEKLPSTTTSDKCSVTSVKVLRIVKSGNDSNAEEDIAKALEERNRKNAEMARQNRLKKKEYVGNLENEVEDGRKRIDDLESALKDAEEERDSYKREVEYLKSVLANQSALAGLLKNIPSVSGVTLSSSLSRKRVAEHDHSYTPLKKGRHDGRSTSSRPAGVCLHVDSGNVSLEFCPHCADMAKLESSP